MSLNGKSLGVWHAKRLQRAMLHLGFSGGSGVGKVVGASEPALSLSARWAQMLAPKPARLSLQGLQRLRVKK